METTNLQGGLELNQKRYTVTYDLPLPAYGIQLQSPEAYRQELQRIADQTAEVYRLYLEVGMQYLKILWQARESYHITIEDGESLDYAFEHCKWPSDAKKVVLHCPKLATGTFLERTVFMLIAAGTLKRDMLEQMHTVLEQLAEKLEVAHQRVKDTVAAVEKCVVVRNFLASEDWLYRPNPHAQDLIEERQEWSDSLEEFASLVSNVSVTSGLKLLEREKAVRDTM